MKKSGELDSIENDFANLARLAAGAAYEDTRLFLARLVRKYRQQRPEFAARLDQLSVPGELCAGVPTEIWSGAKAGFLIASGRSV